MALRTVHMSVEPRAPQASQSPSQTPTLTSSATTTSDTPFFQSTLVPPTRTGDTSSKENLSKTVLACLFGVVALILLGVLITWRTCHLRRKGRPLRTFFVISGPSRSSSPNHLLRTSRSRAVPRTTGLPSVSPSSRLESVILSPSFLYPTLAPIPASHRGPRRTRAADTDAGGRRAGVRDPDDPHGGYDDKEILPAYDNVGGPPKYVELEMQAAGTRLHLQTRGLNSDTSEHSSPHYDNNGETPVSPHGMPPCITNVARNTVDDPEVVPSNLPMHDRTRDRGAI